METPNSITKKTLGKNWEEVDVPKVFENIAVQRFVAGGQNWCNGDKISPEDIEVNFWSAEVRALPVEHEVKHHQQRIAPWNGDNNFYLVVHPT